MSYEAFREQCVKVVDEFRHRWLAGDKDAIFNECADTIRTLPLPLFELMQKPVAFQYRVSHGWSIPEQWTRWGECSELAYYDFLKLSKKYPDGYQVRALFNYTPDAEVLRQENAQLREENKALLDTISMGLASSIKCNCGHLEKYRAEAKKVVDTTLEGGAK